MLWKHYVFRRGAEVEDMWDRMYIERRQKNRPVKLLYISGRGFDVRAQVVMSKYVESLKTSRCEVEKAELLLVGFSGIQLSSDLEEITEKNAAAQEAIFGKIGSVKTIIIGRLADEIDGDDDISANNALRIGVEDVLRYLPDYSDVVLDASSLPRIVYLSLMLGLLHKLLPEKNGCIDLSASGINLQVLVGEDAALDGKIRAEDPSNELVSIPGYAQALQAEFMQDWPLVWFPVLGEGRSTQLQKIGSIIPDNVEICPVLPHPSKDPRRGDSLLIEYKGQLFDSMQTPLTNVLYAHESHPFEAYRQLLGAMQRYQESMDALGGCRLIVTPLASKLITLGAALACFEMKQFVGSKSYSVAIPYAEPTRYSATVSSLTASRPEISAMILCGDAYS